MEELKILRDCAVTYNKAGSLINRLLELSINAAKVALDLCDFIYVRLAILISNFPIDMEIKLLFFRVISFAILLLITTHFLNFILQLLSIVVRIIIFITPIILLALFISKFFI